MSVLQPRHSWMQLGCTVGAVAIAMGGACTPASPARTTLPTFPTQGSHWAASAADGIENPELSTLLFQHWEYTMRQSPTWATRLGDHRFDDQLPDHGHSARELRRRQRELFLAEAQRIQASHRLSDSDAVTLTMLIEQLGAGLEGEVCRFAEWSLSARDNPVTKWNYLPVLHRVETQDDARSLLARYRGIGPAIDTDIENLRRGAADGLYANAETIRRIRVMVAEQLAKPSEEWTLLDPAEADHEDFEPSFLAEYRSTIARVVEENIRPALERYLSLLRDELAASARPEEATGVGSLPLGEACYASQIYRHVGIRQTAETIHEIGLRELAQVNREMRALGERILGTHTLPETLDRLRSDPELYFANEEEIETQARDALTRATTAMPEFFGTLPQAECVVVRVPDYEAPFTTIAYYRGPNPDGSKPGEYFVNVLNPETRPRFEAEVLAFHEAIPGHHLQITISQEQDALPAFRRFTGVTAFVEGWALYTERLSEEMGLYSNDLQRMGMLSFDAWRAARLVVDTGIHALGWSREQAVQFLIARTALSEDNIRNEVDRYISWPGQALAYKLGQLEIFRLRARAQREIGESFELRGFHDAVLRGGAVSLSVLGDQVERWIVETSGAPK